MMIAVVSKLATTKDAVSVMGRHLSAATQTFSIGQVDGEAPAVWCQDLTCQKFVMKTACGCQADLTSDTL